MLILKAQETGRDSFPKGRNFSWTLLGTEMQASNRTWDQRKPTAGMGPALPPILHWQLNLMFFSSYTSLTSLKKEEKNPEYLA